MTAATKNKAKQRRSKKKKEQEKQDQCKNKTSIGLKAVSDFVHNDEN